MTSLTEKGIGIDIIEIPRIRKTITRYGDLFLFRFFTEKEQNYCLQFTDSTPHFAARFAAKEAVVKALGMGFGREISCKDIEILRDEKGKPFVVLAPKLAEKLHFPRFLLSLSHCKDYASAVALRI